MKALVTGGGGFLGRALCKRLLAAGHAVSALGRNDYPELVALGVRCVRADVADAGAVAEAAAGHDVVFHAAAKAGVWGPRSEYVSANVEGTENVIAACRTAAVGRLVFTSSPAVVFDGSDHLDVDHELPYPRRHGCHYAETKAQAERAVLAANGERLATIALRPHLVYGPRDPHLLPRLFARARAGRLAIVGGGRNVVSLTYVENAAAAHVQAAARLAPGAACSGRAYFVTDAEPVELWPWLNRMLERVGLPPAARRVPLGTAQAAGALLEGLWALLSLPGEPPITRFVAQQLARSHSFSPSTAGAAFGYAPVVTANEAFDTTAAWWREELVRTGARPAGRQG